MNPPEDPPRPSPTPWSDFTGRPITALAIERCKLFCHDRHSVVRLAARLTLFEVGALSPEIADWAPPKGWNPPLSNARRKYPRKIPPFWILVPNKGVDDGRNCSGRVDRD
jgi:hypothetical protein